jgi:hypothetical protein
MTTSDYNHIQNIFLACLTSYDFKHLWSLTPVIYDRL